MKLRDIYSSRIMVVGFCFLILGVGNWAVGASQIARYQGVLQKTAHTGLEENYRSFQELDQQKNAEVLRRINEDRERYNPAQVKLDFYYVVLSGGRFFFMTGALLILFAFFRIIRQDASVKMRRLAAQK